MTIEEELKQLIINHSGSVNKFAQTCGLSTSTVATIFTRGVNKTNINTIIKICQTLNISTDDLANGKIVSKDILPAGAFHGGDLTYRIDEMRLLNEIQKLDDGDIDKVMAYIKGLQDAREDEK